MTMTYEVIYRTGGTHYCTWRRVAFKHGHKSMADMVAKDLQRQGFHAEVRSTKELENVGLPVGWTFDAVDWENDDVTVTPYETVHIKRSQTMWYEVRFLPDDIGWEFDTLSKAIAFAEARGEKMGTNYLVYKCTYEGGESFLLEV